MPKSKRRQALSRKMDTAKPSALSRLPPEIWKIIADFIHGRDNLQNLSLVCRDCYALFSPFLAQHRRYHLHKFAPKRPRYMALPPGVEYLKHLEVFAFEIEDDYYEKGVSYYEKANISNYVRYLARLIKAAPKLESFRWYIQLDAPYRLNSLTRHKILLGALKSAQLKKLSLSFDGIGLEPGPEALNNNIPLSGFENLTSLELYNFYGEVPRLVDDIAGVLSRCPGLKVLGLSMSCELGFHDDMEAAVLAGQFDFLQRVCIDYASRGALPLCLKTLRLGWAMCVSSPMEFSAENYLKLLFRPERLQILHIFNGLVHVGDTETEPDELDIDWELLDDCKSLRQLSVSKLNRDVKNWLNDKATSVTELIFNDRNCMDGTAQHYFHKLKHPLTVLVAPEDGYVPTKEAFEIYDEGSSSKEPHDDSESAGESSSHSDRDSTLNSDSETTNLPQTSVDSLAEDAGTFPDAVAPSFAEFLLDIRARNDDSQHFHDANSLSISECSSCSDRVATVLDRLNDRGAHLTQFALSIDLHIQWDHFLMRLENLKKLSHLYVMPRSWRFGLWPHEECSLWAGVREPKEIAARYVQIIKQTCPSVQFVRFGSWTWQLIARGPISKSKNKGPDVHYQMVQLDWSEVSQMQIMAIDTINPQTGLIAERIDPPLSEHLWESLDDERLIREIIQDRMEG